MPLFQFNLEPVLFQRRTREEESQRELAKVMRQRMILLAQLRQMQQTITDSKQALGHSLVGKVDLNQTAQFARYSGQVSVRAHAFVAKLATLERQIQKAQQEFNQAVRARKVLERLRERRYQLWLAQEHRREAAELDELATQRYARRLAMGAAP